MKNNDIKINDIENFDEFMNEFEKVGLEGYFTEYGYIALWDWLVELQNSENMVDDDVVEITFNPKEIVKDIVEYENVDEFNLKHDTDFKDFDELFDEWSDDTSLVSETEIKSIMISNF